MSLNNAMLEKYRNNFLQEVAGNVEQGDWVKMCMQCGVCAGSCPLGDAWEHSPQKIFMMIRANRREQVLSSDSMWMCTSCYHCVVRCPRGLPIPHIMHGLASYAKRLGLAPKSNPTLWFAEVFWNNMLKKGRVNELKLGLSLYFKDGFASGIKQAMAHQKLGINMLKAKRMAPMDMFAGHAIKDIFGLHKMIRKAQEIEAAKLEANSK
ncbi:MAG: 4Fe-4S dicluster domain-containing protein [Gammaproteobacteria bacterium]|nr:4Fe-4S dicluster domain-containing protein [Gammaproteobacteria bacterium]MBL6998445.1 4Fe-4S dicluster domain-containing protein [Gammaproteobacteria bacterium]